VAGNHSRIESLNPTENVQRSTVIAQRLGLDVGRWTFLIPFVLGLVALVGYGVARANGVAFALDNYLALTIASFVCFILGGALLILGTPIVRALAFPLAFLVLMIPFPTAVTHGIEMFFQHTTSSVSYLFFQLSGTPVLRDETVFQLPGLVIRVAEECSGIRSSLVLFITSLVAGCLFLRSPWKRLILAAAVIPLGIVRNAIRVFTIAMLCLHWDPKAIDSPIHHQGGPLFFLMSLVPFFLLLQWLRRNEPRQFD
jgi:exosortase C (VPDSG-CTERM-specific)